MLKIAGLGILHDDHQGAQHCSSSHRHTFNHTNRDQRKDDLDCEEWNEQTSGW